MNPTELDDAVRLCLSLPGVTEEEPFGPDVLVYKVAGKMFATAGEEEGIGRMNLKGNPEDNERHREQYEAVLPGYHMNKRHWNTVVFDGSMPGELVGEMIRESYRLVVAGMPKKLRDDLGIFVSDGDSAT